jgi:hypothetical protein
MSGLALLLGVVLALIGTGLSFVPLQSMTLWWFIVTLIWYSGPVLLLMGGWGIVARQASRAGWLSCTAIFLTFLGGFLYTSFFFVMNLIIVPWLAQVAPKLAAVAEGGGGLGSPALFLFYRFAIITLALGNNLLASSIRLAGIFSRWSGVVMGMSGMLFIFSVIIYDVSILNALVFAGIVRLVAFAFSFLGLGWIGYRLWTTKGEALQQTALTS